MATIDRDQLLQDVLEIMPVSNQLSDSMILRLAEGVIAVVGDDDIYYSEVLCKTLRACGIQNAAKASVDNRGLKKDKTYDVELEFYNTGSNSFWKDWVDLLYTEVCPLFGYTHATSSRPPPVIFVKSEQPAMVVTDCDGNTRTLT